MFKAELTPSAWGLLKGDAGCCLAYTREKELYYFPLQGVVAAVWGGAGSAREEEGDADGWSQVSITL